MVLRVNRSHIQNLVADDRLREFAVFLLFKSKLKKSCAYEYSPSELSKKVPMKPGMIRKYVSTFLDLGWCRMHSGNLIFNNVRSTQKEKIKNVPVDFLIAGTVKQIMTDLYLLILKHKQQQFDKLKQWGRDPIKASKIKIKRNLQELPDQNAQLQVSIRKIAAWFNCSIGKASSIIKELKSLRLITVTMSDRYVVLKSRTSEIIRHVLCAVPGSYYHNGFVFKKPCNFYNF
jgi:hypothetical protein